jgi:hypothetical protein
MYLMTKTVINLYILSDKTCLKLKLLALNFLYYCIINSSYLAQSETNMYASSSQYVLVPTSINGVLLYICSNKPWHILNIFNST